MSPVTAILRPKALRPGDLVAIAALSGPLERSELELYERGIPVIESLGFRVRPAPLVDLEKVWWWAAARPRQVADEVNALVRDPEVRAVWALTGGRFTLSYLDSLDFDAVRADPKPVLGFSDISALQLALHSVTGLVSVSADLVTYGLGDWDTLDEGPRRDLADAYRRVLTRTDAPGLLPRRSGWECWRSGRAEGQLLGGMLHRLVRIQATPYAFAPDRFDGAVLFWEDVGSNTIGVWNDLHVLRHAGVFERIAGMLIGPTSTIEVTDVPGGPDSLREVVLDALGDRDIPVIGNVNLGHEPPNIPLPLGVQAAIDAGDLTISLTEAAVEGR
jgi:muramoyltetrapeptide carboxypeptidase